MKYDNIPTRAYRKNSYSQFEKYISWMRQSKLIKNTPYEENFAQLLQLSLVFQLCCIMDTTQVIIG